MLAEKFFLVLETLKSHTSPDGSLRVTSNVAARPGQAAGPQVTGLPGSRPRGVDPGRLASRPSEGRLSHGESVKSLNGGRDCEGVPRTPVDSIESAHVHSFAPGRGRTTKPEIIKLCGADVDGNTGGPVGIRGCPEVAAV